MKIWRNPVIVIFVTLIVVFLSLSLAKNKNNSEKLKENKAELERQVGLLTEKRAQLDFENKLSKKKTSREKIVRDQKWLQKEGEIILELEDFEEWVEIKREEEELERERARIAGEDTRSEAERKWAEWMEVLGGG